MGRRCQLTANQYPSYYHPPSTVYSSSYPFHINYSPPSAYSSTQYQQDQPNYKPTSTSSDDGSQLPHDTLKIRYRGARVALPITGGTVFFVIVVVLLVCWCNKKKKEAGKPEKAEIEVGVGV